MRRFVLVLLGAVLLTAGAASAVDFQLGPVVGYGDDDGENFYHLGLRGVVGFTDWLGLDLRASAALWTEDTGERLYPLEIGPVFRLKLEKVTPYVGGGIGYYIFDSDADLVVDDDFGFYLMGGLEVPVSDQLSFFAEARYTNVESEGSTSGIRAGPGGIVVSRTVIEGDIDAISGHVGALWKF